mmetsp:Transcript_7678/g.13881  ORF Transcript_7678/g.13881 Transcript_7678/m.13881 type:complete len:86 (+) Transcript_7678:802-1059(+)
MWPPSAQRHRRRPRVEKRAAATTATEIPTGKEEKAVPGECTGEITTPVPNDSRLHPHGTFLSVVPASLCTAHFGHDAFVFSHHEY